MCLSNNGYQEVRTTQVDGYAVCGEIRSFWDIVGDMIFATHHLENRDYRLDSMRLAMVISQMLLIQGLKVIVFNH